jgi:hypothetical protein
VWLNRILLYGGIALIVIGLALGVVAVLIVR